MDHTNQWREGAPKSLEPANRQTPLKLFVDAKRKIHEIYSEVASHIKDSAAFLRGIPEDSSVTSAEQLSKVESFGSQVCGIQEVLARDHMKVAFFGRTSNGKSTVINAMLRDKVLPTGLGHTTDCFLVVSGSETEESYLQVAGSDVKMNVETVSHLANALASERLQDQNAVVNIYWPKSRCHLLQNDVVLMDSPGTDVEASLDEWIDGRCLDADVFVLVSNAESTLMRTEKSFFHKVSERLSKPNIFILNNRWDASASEPGEYMAKVKQQHLERSIEFLADELKVVSRQQAEDRVFFVSAKEALITRCNSLPNTPDSSSFQLAEGYQARLFEFENFERKFEECISHSAVKTKFEQHAKQGRQIVTFSQDILGQVLDSATAKRSSCIEKRKEQMDRLEYVTKQLDLLATECRDQIRDVVEKAESRVSTAMTDEIERLNVLVDMFNESFSADSLVIKVYKEKLQRHLESGIGHNLHSRCSGTVMTSVRDVQDQMTERMSALLPDDSKQQISSGYARRDFELNYRLDCQYLFADFREDLGFRFSLGLTAMMQRFLGPSGTKAALVGFANVIPTSVSSAAEETTGNTDQDLTVAMMTGLASLTSRASMGVVVISGVIWRAVGWKVLAVAGGVYAGLYFYERFTWTNRAKEKKFKKDFVNYATEKLQVLISFTSSNFSHQIQQELSNTYAQLSLEANKAKENLEKETVQLQSETKKLESIIAKTKVLKNKAGWLDTELDRFISGFIAH